MRYEAKKLGLIDHFGVCWIQTNLQTSQRYYKKFNKCGTNIYFFTLQRFGSSPSPNFKKFLIYILLNINVILVGKLYILHLDKLSRILQHFKMCSINLTKLIMLNNTLLLVSPLRINLFEYVQYTILYTDTVLGKEYWK